MRKPRRYWNYETCWNEAWTYKNRNEFKKGNETAYNTARRNGLLGSMFFGDDGFFAGFIGSRDIVYKCENCGYVWKVED